MLRRALLLASAFSLALTGLAGARTHATARQAAAPAATFFISGRGWGHGIGMSQWGAYGYAQRGMTYLEALQARAGVYAAHQCHRTPAGLVNAQWWRRF